MKNRKKLIYIAVAVIALAVLVYFVFIPQISGSLFLFANNAAKKEETTSLKQKKANLENLKKQAKEVEGLSNKLASMLPNNKDSGEFMIQVEALAKDTKVDLADIKFSEEPKTASPASTTDETANKKSSVKGTSTAKFQAMVFEISVTGGYTETMNFLQGLEKINRAVIIERCDLSAAKGTVEAHLKGKAYYNG